MDVGGIREQSRCAHRLAGEVRAVADDAAAGRAVVWVSTRAEQYRRDLAEEAQLVHGIAADLEDASAALSHHAEQVQRRLDQLHAMEQAFLSLVDDARRTVGSAVDGVQDAAVAGAHRVLDAARSIPSPGSLDWGRFARGFW